MLGAWTSAVGLQLPFKRRPAFAAGLGLVLMHLALANDITYFCLFPQSIRPGSDFNVSMTLSKFGTTTVKIVIFADSSGSILVSKTATFDVNPITAQLNALVNLKIPAGPLESSYTVNISGTGAVTFFNSSTLSVIQKSMSLLVQTDKALYKPGQTVKFRVVAIYPNLKSYKDEMDIVIYDKDRNRIAQWLQKRSDQGVFSDELPLSDLTPLGTWSIVVKANSDSTTKTFEVAEYVLPKFEVDVNPPSYYLLYVEKPQLQKPLSFVVTARYTYGQPVKGTAKLTAKVLTWNTEKEYTWMQTVNLVNGTALVEISTEQLSYMVPDSLKKSLTDGTVEAWTLLDGRRINITASVTETVTGVTLSANNAITCYKKKYTLSFLEITPDSYKPGLPYIGYVQLQQKDHSAPILSDIKLPDGQFRKITITVIFEQSDFLPSFPFERTICSTTSLQKTVTVVPSGYMPFEVQIKSNCSARIEALFYDNSTDTNITAEKAVSAFESRAYVGLQVSLANVESSIKPGDVVQLNVLATVPMKSLNYVIMNKGTIIMSHMITNVNAKSYTIRLNVNRELAQMLAPSARCVVWIVTNDSEIICDAVDFKADGAFANNVSVNFDKDKVEPGASVSLAVHGSPGSHAYLCVVDQSVRLLKKGNDITQNMVLDELTSYEGGTNRGFKVMPFFRFWPFPSGGTDSAEVFDNVHLQYVTDGYVHTSTITGGRPWPWPIWMHRRDFHQIKFLDGGKTEIAQESSSPSQPTVRKDFPETWLFEEAVVGATGYGSVNATAPDTITSWVASVFAVSDKDGLGIAPLTPSLTVFRPFFTSMTLPYSIKRGEEFALQVTIFNYLPTNLTVRVLLKASTFFNVSMEQQNISVANTNVTKDIQVPQNDAVTVVFRIKPTTVGQIPIEVSAFAGVAGDAERRLLRVDPEGIRQRYSTSMLIDLPRGNKGFTTTLIAKLPSADLVTGSDRIQITLCGDILGATLNGLDNLIQMPYGCGEQTMLNLAPTVFVADYLNSTGTLTPAIEAKCNGYILSGYQRELTFQRKDGSFSAFGNNDPDGSVWLSSFVCLTFHQAKSYIPVDGVKIAVTMTWIIERQNDNGSFSEPPNGRVIHTDMQGGSSNGVPLTAYVFSALLVNQDNQVINKTLLDSSISMAQFYLEQQLDFISDSYSLCLISYALVLAKSSKANLAVSKRDKLAIVENGLKHWEKIEPAVAAEKGSFIPPYQQSSAIDIEMTSYALLTYCLRKDANGAVPLVKWLITQRNPTGGFVSTQDTVMAIQALACFAQMIYGPLSSFNLHVFASIGHENHAFDPITQHNMQTLQIWEPTTTTGTVRINATGIGSAIAQFNVFYNVHKLNGSNSFSLTTETTVKDGGKTVVVKACTRWTRKDVKCGMALITVELLSGYELLRVEEVGKISGLMEKIEPKPGAVNIYFTTIDNVGVCISVNMTRTTEVYNPMKASIKCLDYYNPGNSITGTYPE